jgi:capsular polysaccharide biosynthesis protein
LDDEYQGNTLIIVNVYDDDDNDKDDDDNYNHAMSETSEYKAQTLMLRKLENTSSNLSQHTYTHTYIVTDVRVSPQLLQHNTAV